VTGDRQKVGVLFAANVLFAGGLFFHAFLYNFYLGGLGHSAVVMGRAAAALTAGSFAALLPAGWLIDRIGVRPTLLAGAALAIPGLALGALVERPVPIYVAASLAGFGTGTWRVSLAPALMHFTTDENRSRVFSWNVGLLVAAGALWTALAGAAPRWGVWRDGPDALRAALLLGAACSLVGLPLFAALRIPRRISPVVGAPTTSGLPAAVPIAVLAIAVWMTAPALAAPFFNVYFQRVHGMAMDRIAVIFGAAHAATALCVVASGELARRLGPKRALTIWVFGFAPMLWSLAATGHAALAVTLYFLQGIVSPASNPLFDQVLLERAPVGRRGVVSSLRNAATELSGILGASAGGAVLAGASFGALFGAAGALALFAGVLVRLTLRRLPAG
jgi:MFS family permease